MNKIFTAILVLLLAARVGAAEPALQDLSTFPRSSVTSG
jgi:hypothetical protein